MSYKLNNKVKNLEPYQPIAGEYRIRLDANESCFDTGKTLGELLSKKIANCPLNRYPDASCKGLLEAYAKYAGVSPESVVASNGSDEMISILIGSFLERDSTVLLISPDFSMYQFYCNVFEQKTVILQKDRGFIIDYEAVVKAAKESGANLILFSNPCNPTSVGMKREDVLKIVCSVEALVVIDEAYMEFYGESVLADVKKYDNLVVLKTCSKALGSAGIRLGLAIAPLPVAKALKAVKSPYNINTITQTVGETIFENPQYIQLAIDSILRSKKKLYEGLLKIASLTDRILKVYPSDTNFITLKCKDADTLYNQLLGESIAIRKVGDLLRVTVGTDSENEVFLNEFEKILSRGGKS